MRLAPSVLFWIMVALICIAITISMYPKIIEIGGRLVEQPFPYPVIRLAISDAQSTPYFIPYETSLLDKIKANKTLRELASKYKFDLDKVSPDELRHGVKLNGYCYEDSFACYTLLRYDHSINFTSPPKYIVKDPTSFAKLKALLFIYYPKKVFANSIGIYVCEGEKLGAMQTCQDLKPEERVATIILSALDRCIKWCNGNPDCESGCRKANLAHQYNCSALENDKEREGCLYYYNYAVWKLGEPIVIDAGTFTFDKKGPLIAQGYINISRPLSGENCFSLNVWKDCLYSCIERHKIQEEGCFITNTQNCLKELEKCREECDCSISKRREFEDPSQICYTFCSSRFGFAEDEEKENQCIFGCNYMFRNLDRSGEILDELCSDTELMFLYNYLESGILPPTYTYSPQCVGAYYLYYINSSVVPSEILYVSEPLVQNLYSVVYILDWRGAGKYYYPYHDDYQRAFLEDKDFYIEDPVLSILSGLK